jgi:GxxExxY protein
MPNSVNHVTGHVVDAGMAVHTELGPGLLENDYRSYLAHQLHLRGFRVFTEVPVDIEYKGMTLSPGYRIDLWSMNGFSLKSKQSRKCHHLQKHNCCHISNLATTRLVVTQFSR